MSLALGLWAALEVLSPAPVRLVVAIGSNYGRPEDPVLQFAEDDAVRVRDLFVELGGVDASRALLLVRPTAQALREQLAEVAGRVSELHAQGHTAELVVYASGHGDNGRFELAGTHLSLVELRELTRRTGADLKLVFVDACDSGWTKKGAQKGQAYALSVEPKGVTGEVFVSSSGATEAAQELGALGGSLFTHHLVAALRGDADFDGDARVTLMEAYTYAARRTVADSVDTGQHPQFDVDLAGAADLVLTELSRGRAQVIFEPGLEGRFVVVSLPKANVVAEVTKEAGRRLSIAVPPGRYLVRHTQGFRVALEELDLPYGGSATVDPRRFVVRDFSEVAMKGGMPEFKPSAMYLSGTVTTAPVASALARFGGSLGYRLALGDAFAGVELGVGQASYRAVGLTTTERRMQLRFLAGARLWWGPVIVMPAVALDGSLLVQSYVRDHEAVIRRVYPALASSRTPGVALGPRLLAEVPLVQPCFVLAGLGAAVRELPVRGHSRWSVGADAQLGMGARF